MPTMWLTQSKCGCLLMCLTLVTADIITHTCNPDTFDYGVEFESEEVSTRDLYVDKTKPLKAFKECYVANKSKQYKDLRPGHITVDCGRCSIWSVVIFAWNPTNKKCWGLTPDLLATSLNCPGKKSCRLSYYPSIILWAEGNNLDCIGDVPEALELGYSCLKADTPIVDVMNGYQTVESTRGLVRSHDNTVPVGYGEHARASNAYLLDISVPADYSNASYVLVGVLSADVSEADQLMMQGDARTCQNIHWNTGNTHNISTRALTFQFTISQSPGSGRGFELCFQWFGEADTDAQTKFKATLEMCRKAAHQRSDFPVFDLIKLSSSYHSYGIIRSHPRYPWNYPRDPVGSFRGYGTTNHTFQHVLRAPNGLRRVAIQVQDFRLAEKDLLEIFNLSHRETRFVEKGQYYFDGNVTIKLTILDSSLSTDKGFLLCYKWISPKEKWSEDDEKTICEDFVYKVDLCKRNGGRAYKKNCRVKGRRKKRKTKRGKKKGKGKRRKKRHHPDEETGQRHRRRKHKRRRKEK